MAKERIVDGDALGVVILTNALDQALTEYRSWENYRKEQFVALGFGKEDLLDLSLCLLSSERRIKYPLPAIDLAACTIKKFGLDGMIAGTPVTGITFNERTGDNDPVQYFGLRVRSGIVSQWRLHFGAHILARCAILDRSRSYLTRMVQKIMPHDILVAADRELGRIIDRKCPYEAEAGELAQNNYFRNSAFLHDVRSFFYSTEVPLK